MQVSESEDALVHWFLWLKMEAIDPYGEEDGPCSSVADSTGNILPTIGSAKTAASSSSFRPLRPGRTSTHACSPRLLQSDSGAGSSSVPVDRGIPLQPCCASSDLSSPPPQLAGTSSRPVSPLRNQDGAVPRTTYASYPAPISKLVSSIDLSRASPAFQSTVCCGLAAMIELLVPQLLHVVSLSVPLLLLVLGLDEPIVAANSNGSFSTNLNTN
mmetsp:Transcript_16647/g.36952  ORF Transcript_16647/g.36952 Transcript_16647/m.36952 type:complete len:214 (+) Transcript_16647:1353-1994(+)